MSQQQTSIRLITITETKSKGRAILAATDILTGTLIFSEEPLLAMNLYPTAHADLLTDFAALPQVMKELVLDLEAHDPAAFRQMVWKELDIPSGGGWWHTNREHGANTKQVLTAFNTNAVGQYLGIKTAMLNHSCLPNAYAAFDEPNNELTVRALRDIKNGEEVCLSHLEGAMLLENKDLRRKMLLLQRGFNCVCDSCVSADEYEAKNPGIEHPTEKLRSDWRDLVAKYRRNEFKLSRNFGNTNNLGLDPDFVAFLSEISAGVVEIMETMGIASIDTLDWYENVISWNEILKDKDTVEEWGGKALDVVGTCVGVDSEMYRGMWQKVNGIEQRLTALAIKGHEEEMKKAQDEEMNEDVDSEVDADESDEEEEERTINDAYESDEEEK